VVGKQEEHMGRGNESKKTKAGKRMNLLFDIKCALCGKRTYKIQISGNDVSLDNYEDNMLTTKELDKTIEAKLACSNCGDLKYSFDIKLRDILVPEWRSAEIEYRYHMLRSERLFTPKVNVEKSA